VGTVSREALPKERMRIRYVAEGVNPVKEVVRQTWQKPRALRRRRRVHARGRPVRPARCEYRGTYQHTGKLAKTSDFEVTANGFGPVTCEPTRPR
jgi:hypothetical protein